MISVCVVDFLIGQARRPWPEVLRAASANYFGLLGLAILLTGIWLLFRAKRWGKVAGTLALHTIEHSRATVIGLFRNPVTML